MSAPTCAKVAPAAELITVECNHPECVGFRGHLYDYYSCKLCGLLLGFE
jgi:hypothetical protein